MAGLYNGIQLKRGKKSQIFLKGENVIYQDELVLKRKQPRKGEFTQET